MRSAKRTVTSRRPVADGDSTVSDGTVVDLSGLDSGGGNPDDTISPGDIVGDNDGGTGSSDPAGGSGGKPRRGRKPRSPKANANVPVEGLTQILVLAHGMLAGITGVEELEIDEGESEKLATTTAAVLAHYPNTVISPKTVDIMTLIMALGSVYGPRAVAFRNRRSEERSNRQHPAQVAPIVQATPAAPAGIKKVDPASGAVGHAPADYVPGFSGFVEQTGRR